MEKAFAQLRHPVNQLEEAQKTSMGEKLPTAF